MPATATMICASPYEPREKSWERALARLRLESLIRATAAPRRKLIPAAVTCYACGQRPAMGGRSRIPICRRCRAIRIEVIIEDIRDELYGWLHPRFDRHPAYEFIDRAARRYLAYRHAYKSLMAAEPPRRQPPLTPHMDVSPGDLIRDEMEFRGWDLFQAGEEIGIGSVRLNSLINGREMRQWEASALANAFGQSADFWRNAEANYRGRLCATAHNGQEVPACH